MESKVNGKAKGGGHRMVEQDKDKGRDLSFP
jgi:hypothetical protein